ncbi:MAG: AGE family epimerase/isomerase [Pseudomonadota bacterium]
MASAAVNFYSRQFLLGHVRSILDFYTPAAFDPTGGLYQNYKDDGSIFAPERRHLVSSCRMVFNFCKAYELFGDEVYRAFAAHGFRYLHDRHWDPGRSGYHWTLKEGHHPGDQTNHCYGLAFVMLCCAAASELGLERADQSLDQVFELMEQHFWDSAAGVYADEATPDWSRVSAYRGQNANMHSCESLLAAFEATGKVHFLDRALTVARTVTVDLASSSDGLIWEHFTPELKIDWDYNRDDPKNLYRPWGFQPGHQVEWSKLLMTLYDHRSEDWMPRRAQELFDRALAICWDPTHGGIFYGFGPDGRICDADKYFWVHAEAIAAAARLYQHTESPQYLDWYNRLWQYAWEHFVDHQHGAWYRVLRENNQKYSDEKSAAGAKCDYHTIGACWDVLRHLP